MASPNLVLVDHYIHHSSTTCGVHQQPQMMMEIQEDKPLTSTSRIDLKRSLADGNPTAATAALTAAAEAKGVRRQQYKKLKIMHQYQPAPLAPRLIAPLQARPRMIMTTSAANTTCNTTNYSHSNIVMVMPPMPTNPHEIAKEAMRITQEAMKKQKLQDLEELQKQQQQQSSTSLLSPPPALMLSLQSTGAFPSTSATATKTRDSSTRHTTTTATTTTTGHVRLNKFVRRLYEMLRAEKNSGIVEWKRRGLLVLHNTQLFAKTLLPKYFNNTRNFKTFRRQLNYYGFVHVRSFSNNDATNSTTGPSQPSTTTALWVHQELAASASATATAHQRQASSSSSSSSQGSAENQSHGNNNTEDDDDDIAAVLQLRRIEACGDGANKTPIPKTAEGRRHRKEQAIHTVEEDLGVNAKTLQMEHIQSLLIRGGGGGHGRGAGIDALPMTNATAITSTMTGAILPTAATTAAGGATPFAKALLDECNRRAARAAATTTTTGTPVISLQRLQPLLPAAVPLEISLPRNSSATAALVASSSLDQDVTYGAANLLLLLSKPVCT